jgi:hypothetical protein
LMNVTSLPRRWMDNVGANIAMLPLPAGSYKNCA